jgi:hypothetical protein
MFFNHMRLVRVAAVLCAGSSLAACATVTRGSNDAWVVNTEPSGAKVETSNGHQCPSTPCAIKIKRKSEFTATITKAGYKPATVNVTHKTANAGAAGVAGNVLLGGVIGLGVDMYSGASQDLTPNPVSLKLEPVDLPKPVEVKAESVTAAPAPAAAPAAAGVVDQKPASP